MVKDKVLIAYTGITFSKCPLLRVSCGNLGRSSFQTHVVSFWVSFFTLLLPFFCFFDFPRIFIWYNQRKKRINWIPRLRILYWIFWEKKIIKKFTCSRSLPHPDFLVVTISSHVIYSRFLPIFRHLWKTH